MPSPFITRKYAGTGKNIKCIKCNKRERINSSHICYRCFALNSLTVNSGNNNIDNFIKETQSLEKSSQAPFLEWIPFEEFINVEKIGHGGFSEIYRATWEVNAGVVNNSGTVRRKQKEIVLKVLNNSKNVDAEFLDEVIIICLFLLIISILFKY